MKSRFDTKGDYCSPFARQPKRTSPRRLAELRKLMRAFAKSTRTFVRKTLKYWSARQIRTLPAGEPACRREQPVHRRLQPVMLHRLAIGSQSGPAGLPEMAGWAMVPLPRKVRGAGLAPVLLRRR